MAEELPSKQWPLSLGGERTGHVERFHDQVVLRVERWGKLHCNIALSRAEAVHIASNLRDAAIEVLNGSA